MKKLFVVALALSLALGVTLPASADSFFDNFNRPDAANLGSNWTTGSGSIGIANNMAASSFSSANYATVNGFSGSYLTTRLSVDALSTSTNLNYVALMLGYANSSNNLFIKVQDQNNANKFGKAAFYYGNNGGGYFFDVTPFDAGRITVYAINANTIQLDIDSNFDGIADQSYTHAYSASQIAALGPGIGLGMYGPALADNYAANVVPLPGTLLLFGPGLVGLAALRRKLGR
jgi:hypothetical protein